MDQACEERTSRLLNDRVRFQLMESVIHETGTKLSPETLLEVKENMAAKTFNVTDYPQLSVMKSGQPHYRRLVDHDGDVKGTWFKFMCLDFEDLGNLDDPDIVNLIQELADHVRGERNGEEWVRGFEKFSHLMTGNRDGALTAFTTGITLLDSYITSPVAHSTLFKNNNQEFMEWLQTFHVLLGDLGGKVIRLIMSEEYLQFAQERHEYYNPTFFGSKTGSQTFFTSSQINRSRPTLTLGGTAGNVHCDPTDCDISYSMSINLSVIRDSTDLGYFWFTDYDCLVPLKPMQICIFQGVEEHTGTPLITNPDDMSPLPRGYAEETRFNLICYPKKPILNNTAQRNYGKALNAPSRPNLFQDALYQFGGVENYNTWRARETLRLTIPHLKNQLDFSGALVIDPVQCYNMINFSDTATLGGLPATDGTSSTSDQPPASGLMLKPSPYQMQIEKTLDSAPMDSLIESLGSIIRFNKRQPFHSAGKSVEAAKLGELLRQAGNVPQKRTALHHVEEESSDDEDEEAIYRPDIDPESVLQQIDIGTSSEDERPGGFVRSPPVTVAELKQFTIFHKDRLSTELNKTLNWTAPAQSQHRFSMKDHLKQLIPTLPPATAKGEGRSSSTIAEFSVAYASILGQLNWKSENSEIVQAGILATFGKLTLEWLEQIENDFSDLFNPNDNSLELHPNSVGYRLKTKIDEYVETLNGDNDTTQLFHFDAEEIIGEGYNENFHLNVDLKPERTHSNTTRVKSRAYRNVIWGMCLFWPLHLFVSAIRGVKPSVQTSVQLPLGSRTNHNFINLVGRWRFLQTLCNLFSAEQFPAQSFLFVAGVYKLAFTFRGRVRLSQQVIEQVSTLIHENPDLIEMRETIQRIATGYNSRFDLDLFLKNQGNRALENLLSTPSQQNQVAKRTAGKPKSRTTNSRAVKRRKTGAGGETADKQPKETPAIQLVFDLSVEQLSRYEGAIATYNLLPGDTAPVLCLIKCFFNAFELTKLCLDRVNSTGELSDDQWRVRMREESRPGVKGFMKTMSSNPQNADKYCAIRTSSPSFRQMRFLLNPNQEPLRLLTIESLTSFVRQLLLFRTAFGMPRLIRYYESCTTLESVLEAQSRYKTDELVDRPKLVHNALHLSAYGQLRIKATHVADLYPMIFAASSTLARFLLPFQLSGTKPSFQAIQEALNDCKIIYMKQGSLMNWLSLCDMAEFGICEYPDLDLLVSKICSGGGAGPGIGLNIAFAHVDRERKPPMEPAELRRVLEMVEVGFDQAVGDEWENLTGRRPNTADTEHLLCKVKRIAPFLK